MTTTRTIVEDVGTFSVIGLDGYIMEVFRTREDAAAYLAEYESALPKTAGEVSALAKRHNALFQNY